MTRIYGYNETLAILRGAGRYTRQDNQVFGVSADGTAWNPYYARKMVSADYQYADQFSPVGLFLFWIGLDPAELDNISDRHNYLCADMNCWVCSEEGGYGDTSLYSKWVVLWLEEQDVALTEEARDLLWQAERSGLALYEWLEVQHDRALV